MLPAAEMRNLLGCSSIRIGNKLVDACYEISRLRFLLAFYAVCLSAPLEMTNKGDSAALENGGVRASLGMTNDGGARASSTHGER